eukprot:Nitzschia sp. Nitz4//scaffold78_size91513//1453//2501//NITZ4_004911-RA/size91513-processed-gene-0.79-mRNA-1//-1//CDS//3329558076//5246//frame0
MSFDSPQEMLTGILRCLSEWWLPIVTLESAYEQLGNVPRQQSSSPSIQNSIPDRTDLEYKLGCLSFEIAQEMCIIGSRSTEKGRKHNWDDLLLFSTKLQNHPVNDTTVLGVSLVFGALSLWTVCPNNDAAKSAASALSSTVSRNQETFLSLSKDIPKEVLRQYLIHACDSDTIDLQILTQFARAFRITDDDDKRLAANAARAIRHALRPSLDSSADPSAESQKQSTAAALALSCQVCPCSVICFVAWSRKACKSANEFAKSNRACEHDKHLSDKAVLATELLIDAAMEEKSFGLADKLATSLYSHGGKSRFVEARFHHACETIRRVAKKRTFPLIER